MADPSRTVDRPNGAGARIALDFGAEGNGRRSVDRAYHFIRRIIISGEVAPGTHLTETQLSEATGLSRTPIRDALQRLRTEGLVVRGPNNGAAVASFTESDVAAIREIRCRLEGYAAERAATRITAEQLDRLSAINGELERILHARPIDRIGFADLNIAFHLGIADAAASSHLKSQIQAVIHLPLILLRRTLWPSETANERGLQNHREIIEALELGDAYWAGTQMRAHIASSFRD